MSRPPLEVADIIRAAGKAFIERNRHWLGWKHVKVLLAIVRCRTAALGGHLDECTRCGHRAPISHPHVHCVAPAGGLSPDRGRWVGSRENYFLPKKVLRKIFRGKF